MPRFCVSGRMLIFWLIPCISVSFLLCCLIGLFTCSQRKIGLRRYISVKCSPPSAVPFPCLFMSDIGLRSVCIRD